MSNGRTHTTATIALTPAAAYAGFFAAGSQGAVISVLSMLLTDLLLSPDLDHSSGADAYHHWGPLRFIWKPYQRVIRHRTPLLHAPVIGSLLRLAYLAVVPAVILMATGRLEIVVDEVLQHPEEITAVAIGIGAADLVHGIWDLW